MNKKGTQTNTGKTHFKKGHIPANKGVPFSDEIKKKMSETRLNNLKNGKIIIWNKGTKGLVKAWNKDIKMPEISGNNHPMFGKQHTEESRQKISESLKGKLAWNKGKKLSKEHIEKLKISHLGKMTGEQNPNWKGGITPIHNKIRSSIEGKLWINSVFARDGYICQKTGLKGGKITAHHIINFSTNPDLRFAIDNGITLSIKSHQEFHRKYGRKNNTREQLEEFLNKKLQ